MLAVGPLGPQFEEEEKIPASLPILFSYHGFLTIFYLFLLLGNFDWNRFSLIKCTMWEKGESKIDMNFATLITFYKVEYIDIL